MSDMMNDLMTVGQLASQSCVPRTTIQYYEQVGLIMPVARSPAGYRLYSHQELARVRQISQYRATGLTLDAIRAMIAGASHPEAIARRLQDIDRTMELLKQQRAALVRLQGAEPAPDPEAWDALVRGASLDDAAMHRWHKVFERQNPDAHRTFLLSLGIPADDVERIRRDSDSRA